MARVTVEDCVERIPNRFELVMVAAQRSRKIGSGAPLTVDRDNDKNPVVSLREIADETVSITDLKEELVRTHQRVLSVDDDSEDVIDMMEGEQEWNTLAARSAAMERDFVGGEDEEEDEDEGSEGGLEDIAGNYEDFEE